MNIALQTSRRDVFKLAGAGVVVYFGFDPLALADRRPSYPSDFHAYLSIRPDGRVTVFSGKIEMGQGVLTSQAQMAAEELGVDLDQIEMVLGDTDRCPWDMGTYGSLTTRMFGPHLRAACAKARETLIGLAAKRLAVDPAKLDVKSGVVFVAGDPARKVSYGALAKDVAIAESVSEVPALHTPDQYTIMGRPATRLDGVEKVTGGAKYAADIRRPGMLYAAVLRAPEHGATLTHVDTAAAQRLPGVTVVNQPDLVAVLHRDPEAARTALSKVAAQWKRQNLPLDQETIFDHLMTAAKNVTAIQTIGDVAGSRPARSFEATYHKGYVAHAPMEPHAALAELKDGRMTVWASTQTPFPARDDVATALGFDPKNVRVITPYLGGGFGGKSAGLQTIEAAKLAKITGKPVQVAWSRAEEFYNDTFDPATVVTLSAGLDKNNRISHWNYVVYAAPSRGAKLFYDIANVRVRKVGGALDENDKSQNSLHPFGVGPWRAPGANMNIFAVESSVDALAAMAKTDPLAFRFKHLSDQRMRKVLQACADAFGWRASVGPSGRGVGMALSIDAGSYVATMAEVKVDRATGKVRVMRIVSAIDIGPVVNPEGARMQCEGGLTMGLGYTLAEELRFKGGDILDKNFDTYQIPRFSWVPPIEIVLVKNDSIPPQGCGEPSITTTGGAIANAVFDATGARLPRLPMTPERVLQALKSKGQQTPA